MNGVLRKDLIFIGIFIVFIISSLSAVTYLNSSNVFDAEITYLNDKKIPYSFILNIDTLVNENLKYNIEVIYKKQNRVISQESINCKALCELKIDIDEIYFDDYEVKLKTKFNKGIYEKTLAFTLKDLNINLKSDFKIRFEDEYNFKDWTFVNINGKLKNPSSLETKYFFHIFPENLEVNIEKFNFTCIGSCDFNFELKKDIIFGKYIVRIYSPTEAIEESFIISKNLKEKINPYFKKLKKNNFENSSDYRYLNLDEDLETYELNVMNYSNFEKNIIVEEEDILGELNTYNLDKFSGSLNVKYSTKKIRLFSRNTSDKKIIHLESKVKSYENLDDLEKNIKLKKKKYLSGNKSILSEKIQFNSKSYDNISFFKTSIEDKKSTVPGFGKIVLVLSDGSNITSYFANGLVSINTKKPLYRVNESVDIYMVVLDNFGDLYSDANISLEIINSKGIYSYSSDNLVRETIKDGLYYLNFSKSSIGRQNLTVFVEVNGINLDVGSYFNVLENYPYDIIRKVPFTIDPWQGPFENEFTIIPYNGVGRFSFYEEIPKDFIIYETNGAEIIQRIDSQLLIWSNVNENFKPWYRANSPLKSPYLYELGKSWLDYKENSSIKRFYENRSWLFAIDPATTFEYGDVDKQIKTFYLDNNGGTNGLLDMFDPATSSSVRILEFGTYEYNLTYNLEKDLDIEDKIIFSLTVCMNKCGNNKDGDLKVEIYDSSGNLVATETRLKIFNPGTDTHQEIFILTPLIATVSSGDLLRVVITSVKKDNDIYTGSGETSSFDVYTYDHVSVDDITIKNETGIEKIVFATGDDVNFYANVSDSLRISDISDINITIYYPNGTLRTENILMNHQSNSSPWVYYNYTTSILVGDPIGTYTVDVVAYEGLVTHTSKVFFSKLSSSGNAVSIVPSRIEIANPSDVVEVIHYVFNLDDSVSHSYNLDYNSSYVTTFYEDNGVILLTDNDGDEIVDTDFISPGNFKKIVAKITVPSDAFIGSKNLVILSVEPASVNYYGIEDFESYSVGDNPSNWYDSKKNFSLVFDQSLFNVKSVGVDKVLGTSFTLNDTHTHYNGSGALNLSNYEITGRLRYTDINSSLGISFLSNYPNSEKYYSFRVDSPNSSVLGDGTANQFHLFSNNGGSCSGDINSNQNTENNTWYKFRIRVNDTGSETNILSKIWKESSSEFPFWQINCNVSGVSRLINGTVGFWTKNDGSKYLDDLRIANITIDSSVVDSVTDTIQIQSNIGETKELYLHDNSGTYELNTTLKASNNIRRLTKNSKITFIKLPNLFYEDFYLNGTIDIPLYVLPDPTKGAGAKSTVLVDLYHGTTLISSDTHVDITTPDGNPFLEIFSLEPIVDYIPKDVSFTLEITSFKKDTDLYLDYTINPSKISFPTYTYISVKDISVRNTSGNYKDIFDINETMIFEINITDPFERAAISSINLSILDPNNDEIYIEVIPTFESFGTFWEFYNFTFTNTSEAGTYTINVNVLEDNGVVKTGTTTRLVLSTLPAVSITPNRLGSTIAGISKEYSHSVTNANGIDYDIIDLNVSSSISTVTLYQSDGITPLTDTNDNGVVDLGYVAPGDTVNIVANIFIPGGTPVDSVDYVNLTAVSYTDTSKTSIVTDQTTVLLADPELKQLHLHKPGASYFLNVTTGNSQVFNERVNEGSSITFDQEANFSREFKFTSDIEVKTYLIAEPSKGSGGKANIKAELKTLSGTTIGSETLIDVPWTSTPQLITFTINPLVTSVAKDDGIQLILSSVKKETDFSYGDATYDSFIEMETSTFINVKTLVILNSSFGVQANYLYNTTFNITFKSNVTDPFGAYDIEEVNISITAPNGSYIVLDQVMTLESSGSDYKYFNYTREFVADNDIGIYNVYIAALESNGVISNSSGTFLFLSDGPEVQITPDNIGEAAANTTIEFIHTITNAYVEDDDVADITYTINIGNVSFTDIGGSALTDSDSDGIIDSGTLTKSGGSKLIKAIIEVPSTLNPGDNITLNIYVNSSLNSSRQDSAIDIVNIINDVPVLKSLYLHDTTIGVLNTSEGVLASTTKVSIAVDGSYTWVQSPTFFKDFDHTGIYNLKVYLDTPGGKTTVKAELKTSGGTLIGSETKTNFQTSGAELSVFSISPPMDFIPNGEGLNLTISDAKKGVDVYFDSSVYDSKLDVNTLTYISVDSIKSYNASISEIILFPKNETVILKINVSDPFTVTDIIESNITISYPNGSKYIDNQALTLETSGTYWNYYNLSISDVNTQIKGLHSIEVISLERNGVTSTGLGEFIIDNIAPVISLVSSSPSFLILGEITSLRATITDNLKLNETLAYVQLPNGTVQIHNLISIGSNIFEYNFSNTSVKGNYQFFINSSDTSQNYAISSTFIFKVVGPRILIGVESDSNTYKSGQDLDLISKSDVISVDKESSIIKLNISAIQIDKNTSNYIYSENSGPLYNKFSSIGVSVEIDYYNASFSILNLSVIPDLQVSFYDGFSYSNSQVCDLNLEYGESGSYSFNCTIYSINKSLNDIWAQNPSYRNISIKGLYLDNNGSLYDVINYSKIYLHWDLPSNLRNYGFSNLSILNLSLKIQENSTGSWFDYQSIYNQNIILNVGDNFDLSSYWNTSNWIIPNSIDLGYYRVDSSLINSLTGMIANDDYGNLIEDNYGFVMDYLKINIISPNSSINQSPSKIWYNVSLESNSFSSGGWCAYDLNGISNVSMNQINSSYFAYNVSTINFSEGFHNLTFYCNDSVNYISEVSTNFSYYDNLSPIITLYDPLNNTLDKVSALNFTFLVSDDLNITNCSIYIDGSLGNFSINTTRDVNSTFIISGISSGIHTWNVSCIDQSLAMNVGFSQTWTFELDLLAPQINFTSPTYSNNSYVDQPWTQINISVNETNFDSSWLNWEGINETLSCNNISSSINICIINKSFLLNGPYTYFACANDSFSNENCSETRIVNINKSLPEIMIISPLNNSKHFQDEIIYFNITTSIPANLSYYELESNSSIYNLINTSSLNWTDNLLASSLAFGFHNITFYTRDEIGNVLNKSHIFHVLADKYVNINKSILALDNDVFRVSLNITNFGLYQDYILYDFIDTDYTYYNFSLYNDGFSQVSGFYTGDLLTWNLSLAFMSYINLSYYINSTEDYSLEKNFITAID